MSKNYFESIKEKILDKVSWDGVPFFKSSNCVKYSSWTSKKSAIFSKSVHLHIIP